MDDLCVICPNSHWRAVVESFLNRAMHLGIREVTYQVHAVSMESSADSVMAATMNQGRFNHCLVLMDADGFCDARPPSELERELNAALEAQWGGDAQAIVADPCLEGWLLEGHRAFSRVPGLRGHDLRRWMVDAGHWPMGSEQPDQPKHVLHELFNAFGVRPSAANYRIIAEDFPIRMDRIDVPSLRKFILTLRSWFLL